MQQNPRRSQEQAISLHSPGCPMKLYALYRAHFIGGVFLGLFHKRAGPLRSLPPQTINSMVPQHDDLHFGPLSCNPLSPLPAHSTHQCCSYSGGAQQWFTTARLLVNCELYVRCDSFILAFTVRSKAFTLSILLTPRLPMHVACFPLVSHFIWLILLSDPSIPCVFTGKISQAGDFSRSWVQSIRALFKVSGREGDTWEGSRPTLD